MNSAAIVAKLKALIAMNCAGLSGLSSGITVFSGSITTADTSNYIILSSDDAELEEAEKHVKFLKEAIMNKRKCEKGLMELREDLQ